MFTDFFSKTFYGNTLSQWGLALLLIFGSVLVAKIFYWISGNVIKKLTKKTKTKLDDILVDMLEEPIVFFIIIIGLWYALNHILHFQEATQIWINRIYYILTIFNIAWLVTRTVDALIEHYVVPLTEKTKTDLDDILLPIFRSSFRVIIWTLAIVVGLNNAGYNVGAILTGLGIGGLAFALAAKDTISNIFGGLVVLTNRPFLVGDIIQYEDIWAEVKTIGLRSTKLEHFDFGFSISVPNSHFLTNSVMNISGHSGYLYFLDIKISQYTSPDKLEKAMKILGEVGKNNQRLKVKDVRVISFDNYAITLRLYIDVNKFSERHIARTELRVEIHRLFYENQIKFSEYAYSTADAPVNNENKNYTPFKVSEYLSELKK